MTTGYILWIRIYKRLRLAILPLCSGRYCKQLVTEQKMGQPRDSLVTIGTGLRTGRSMNRVSIPGREKRFVSSPKLPDRFWVSPSLPSQRVLGDRSPNVKRPRREAGYPTAPSAGPNNYRRYISTPMCLHGVYTDNKLFALTESNVQQWEVRFGRHCNLEFRQQKLQHLLYVANSLSRTFDVNNRHMHGNRYFKTSVIEQC
jgi:hypothetical protein